MGVLEIVLLAAGGIIAVLSFMLPVKEEEVSGQTKELAREEIKGLVDQEMQNIRGHVDDVVDEAVGYAVEKTERSLERLTNEKIMAVNEYSDTVLKEIHKNHEEAMFLYDMLNDKHINLKNTVSEANRTVQEVVEKQKEAEVVVSTFQQIRPQIIKEDERVIEGSGPEQKADPRAASGPEAKQGANFKPVAETQQRAGFKTTAEAQQRAGFKPTAEAQPALDLNFMADGGKKESNEKILALYKQGKSKVAIAKKLGLGVGEVKLVIDLYNNL